MSFIIAIEGIDGSGKSTLASAISKKIGFTRFSYPDRQTFLGKVIDKLLTEKEKIDPTALAHLFAANRWETADFLRSGQRLVLDRYTLSGQAYALTNGVPEEVVRTLDVGLPVPSLTVFLDTSPETAMVRLQGSRGSTERFETSSFQQKVYQNYKKLLKELPQERVMILSENVPISTATDMIQNWYEIFGASC